MYTGIIAMNPKSTMGTVISSRHLQRIESMISRTTGKVVAGGERMVGKSELDAFDFSKGFFFPPTVISDINLHDELWKEEIFGPVVVVTRFSVRCL
jgi:acyl-CoA reductase-like NAD-dependent aldehyde dehydrogenase